MKSRSLIIFMRLFVAATLALTAFEALSEQDSNPAALLAVLAGIAIGGALGWYMSARGRTIFIAPVLVFLALRILSLMKPEAAHLDQAADVMFAVAAAAWLAELIRRDRPRSNARS